MVQRFLRLAGVAAVGILASASWSTMHAQPAASSPLDQLLVEVRQLRGEIKQAADSSMRAQLFVARLQLQEQRVNAVARQLMDVQNRLAAVRQQQAELRQRLTASEEEQNLLPAEDRSDDQIRALRVQVEQAQAREDELRARETTLIAALTAEQARWSEFNERLDALERSLSAGRSR